MTIHARRIVIWVFALLTVIGSTMLHMSQPAHAADSYPAQWKNQPLGATYDTWGHATRYCTSWVGWALHERNQFELPFHDHAAGWGAKALAAGYGVDAHPAIGSVAWWNSDFASGYGHVAYVEAVSADGSAVRISEYNYDYRGNYHERTIAKGSPSGYIHFKDSVTSSPLPLSGVSPIRNGSFNGDIVHWSTSGLANLAQYSAGSGVGTNPYEGIGFAAANASQRDDSISQTRAITISAGDSYCASARLVTVGAKHGSSGRFVLWLLGSTNDASIYAYDNLPGANNWQSAKTCVMATGSRTHIKVQFYPEPGSPTIGVDAVDVHQTLNTSGGFNNGNSYWNLSPKTNLATYTATSGVGTSPFEGKAFGALDSAQAGGGLWQDLPHVIAPGDTFCAEVQVVTIGQSMGASGSLALYLTGANSTEESVQQFRDLAGGDAWKPVKSCVTATAAHSNIRVQIYPAVDGPTLGVDALDVHASIMLNGGFNANTAHWSAHGSLGYIQAAAFGRVRSYEGNGFGVLQTDQANAGLSESRSWAFEAGDTFCAEAMVASTDANNVGGTLALWLFSQGSTDVSTNSFSDVAVGVGWVHIQTCVMATANSGYDGVLRVQLYPSTNNQPVAVDAVDVH